MTISFATRKSLVRTQGQTGLLAATALVLLSASASADSITSKPFGQTASRQALRLYTLTNTRGSQVQITNFGGTVTSIKVPDRRGRLGDVVLGYDSAANYVANTGGTYFGALIGRYANRIARGKFSLDGTSYQIAVNNKPNSLHGGKIGFNQKVWTATPFAPCTASRWPCGTLVRMGRKTSLALCP